MARIRMSILTAVIAASGLFTQVVSAQNTVVEPVVASGESTHLQVIDQLYGTGISNPAMVATGVALANAVNSEYSNGTITVRRMDDFGGASLLNMFSSAPGSPVDDDEWTDGITTATVRARFAGFPQEFGFDEGAGFVSLFMTGGSGFSVTGASSASFSMGASVQWIRRGTSGNTTTNVHSSLPSMNFMGLDQMVTYHVTGAPGAPANATVWLVFWEDLNGALGNNTHPDNAGNTADRDFNDLVVEIEVVECTMNSECNDGNACTSDVCDAGMCVNGPEPAGTVCGNQLPDGACDLADVCDGAGMCDSNPVPVGTVCRASAGVCDIEEVCDGVSVSCPTDILDNVTICRVAAGVCDAEEICSGFSVDCPADIFQDDVDDKGEPNICRSAVGACDVAEVCSGFAIDCPADSFDTGSVCRPSLGVCDPEEVCDGTGVACPADGKSTAECRASAGVCDVAEVCDGVGNDCPADGFDTGTVCGPSLGVCDIEEVCDGTGAGCPADMKDTGECRASAGVCDIAEICDGVGNDCPADGFDTGTVCGPSQGVCDVEEVCDGTGAGCPADMKGTGECRPAAGECDIAEVCDGATNDCPADDLAPMGTVCTDDGNECTADICTGSAVTCFHVDTGLCGACCLASKACDDPILALTCSNRGGTFLGEGTICLGDSDGDGSDDQCDNCPGVDDAVFGAKICKPSGQSCNSDVDCLAGEICEAACVGEIPTVSEWGLVVLALLLLVAGKLYFGKTNQPAMR